MKKIFLTTATLLSLFLIGLFFTSCASSNANNNGVKVMSEAEYEKTLDQWTKSTESYSGLYNIVNMSATLLNSEMQGAYLDQSARVYQWDQAKFMAEKGKAEDSMRNQTEFFLSFYTPEKKTDTLSKNNSQWKIFLDADGRRYEGKATKVKLETAEIQGFYPHHTRFATPYRVTFPVAIKSIESKVMKLTLTSPTGSASLDF